MTNHTVILIHTTIEIAYYIGYFLIQSRLWTVFVSDVVKSLCIYDDGSLGSS